MDQFPQNKIYIKNWLHIKVKNNKQLDTFNRTRLSKAHNTMQLIESNNTAVHQLQDSITLIHTKKEDDSKKESYDTDSLTTKNKIKSLQHVYNVQKLVSIGQKAFTLFLNI